MQTVSVGSLFPQTGVFKNALGARKLAEITKIDRRTLGTHFNSKALLKDIRYKPFVKGSPSNYWGKRAVSICFANINQVHVHESSLPYNITSVNREGKLCFVK